MLKYILNDIVQVEADLLINASNAQGYMGGFLGKYIRLKGVAESIHYMEPDIENQSKVICKSKNLTPGDIFHTSPGKLPFHKGILHAITMNKPGQRSELINIENCLKNIITYCDEQEIETAAIPFLGCGTGRLPKEDVISLYKKYLDKSKTIFLVVDKPVKA